MQPLGPLRAAVASMDDPHRTIHAAWSLFRLNSIRDDELIRLAAAEDAMVRLHSLRILAETATMDAKLQSRLLARLDDSDLRVRRLAVEAIGRHPEMPAVRRLLQLLAGTPDSDVYLRHTIRIAIRNQLRSDSDQLRPDVASTA